MILFEGTLLFLLKISKQVDNAALNSNPITEDGALTLMKAKYCRSVENPITISFNFPHQREFQHSIDRLAASNIFKPLKTQRNNYHTSPNENSWEARFLNLLEQTRLEKLSSAFLKIKGYKEDKIAPEFRKLLLEHERKEQTYVHKTCCLPDLESNNLLTRKEKYYEKAYKNFKTKLKCQRIMLYSNTNTSL